MKVDAAGDDKNDPLAEIRPKPAIWSIIVVTHVANDFYPSGHDHRVRNCVDRCWILCVVGGCWLLVVGGCGYIIYCG